MTPKAYVERGREKSESDFIEKIVRRVRNLTLEQLLDINPTMAQMRSLEYVRDIGYGHYPHHSNYELEVVVSLLDLHRKS
jgi:hypothetical protein